MLFNIDNGYKFDPWLANSAGDRYLEGSHFFQFIVDNYGQSFWRKTLADYLNSYWNIFFGYSHDCLNHTH
jgi:hypothetical protein